MYKCAGCGRKVDPKRWKQVSHLCDACLDYMTAGKKRRYLRLSVGREVEYRVLHKNDFGCVDTSTKNISAVGLCIIAFEKLEIGDTLDLQLSIPRFVLLRRRAKRVISAKGRVVWIGELKIGGNKTSHAYEMGIELVGIEKEDQEKLRKYVASKLARHKIRYSHAL